MKKFNYKSRKGFTLIELLVVIGILAVLAAIAIPSVAGLIDRANVSADDTNANEMTNAIERFTSEYELFCQDIASGRLNKNDMDAAQSRVYTVTGAENRDDIKDLESEDGLDGKKINRDTKYPENIDTTKAIVENYTKTSSATYEPKQSDMNFYYSPDCGVIVVDEATDGAPNVTELNKLIISGKDAKGKTLDENTEWINLTNGSDSTTIILGNHGSNSGDLIPEGAEYITSTGDVLVAGTPFPTNVNTNDVYEFGDYVYAYNKHPNGSATSWLEDTSINGWGVQTADKTKTSYGEMLASINGMPVTSAQKCFINCKNMTTLSSDFRLPATVISTAYMFSNCTALTTLPSGFTIPYGVTSLTRMFYQCNALNNLPSSFSVPSSVITMNEAFYRCISLEKLPANALVNCRATSFSQTFGYCYLLKELPSFKLYEGTTDVNNMFKFCESLEYLPNGFTIPSTVTKAFSMFSECDKLRELPEGFSLSPNAKEYYGFFYNCHSLKKVPDTFRLPDDATNIMNLFYECNSLETIPNNFVIPATVTSVSNAFLGCSSLKNATIVFNASLNSTSNFITCAGSEAHPITITGSGDLTTIGFDSHTCHYIIK